MSSYTCIWVGNDIVVCSIPADLGKVYYITVQESWVEPGDSQRRPGLHVDSPGKVKIKGEDSEQGLYKSRGNGKSQEYTGHRWGSGCTHYVEPQSECEDYDYDYDEKLLTVQVI